MQIERSSTQSGNSGRRTLASTAIAASHSIKTRRGTGGCRRFGSVIPSGADRSRSGRREVEGPGVRFTLL